MNSDKFKGTVNNEIGKGKQKVADVINSKNLKQDGLKQEGKGTAQKFAGNVKETFQKGSHSLGDGIEKVGRKLQEKGFPKAGATVEKVGDKIEHMADDEDDA